MGLVWIDSIYAANAAPGCSALARSGEWQWVWGERIVKAKSKNQPETLPLHPDVRVSQGDRFVGRVRKRFQMLVLSLLEYPNKANSMPS
jgi:hypothetical protein